jgi:hypothetical protein
MTDHHDDVPRVRPDVAAPLRGALLRGADLSGLEIRDSDVSGLRIVDCLADEVSVSGALGRVIVDDVDVTDHVREVLDARLPVRRLAREATTPDQLRYAWDETQRAWDELITRVRDSPADLASTQVDGEWSLVQTLRHLRFAADAWIGTAVLAEPRPHHPWGLPADGTTDDVVSELGLDLLADPGLVDVLAVRAERRETVERLIDSLTEAALDRVCDRTPGPGYPIREYTVRRCLRVVLGEEAEHLRYTLRDQAVLRHAMEQS